MKIYVYTSREYFLGKITFNFVCFYQRNPLYISLCDLQHYQHKASSITMYTLLMSRLFATSPWISSSSFAFQNFSSVQSHALNNNGGYFPPQNHDQYSGYIVGLFGANIRRSSTANN